MRPIKNRIEEPLDVLDIRIDHAEGTYRSCPNGIAASAIWGMSGDRPELPPTFVASSTQLFDPKTIRPKPGLRSVLSDGEAVMYRSDDVEIALTPDELFRLMKRSLRPDEVLRLLDHFGEFHEIHDDFYDPETGEAFQPMDDGPDQAYQA